MFDMEIFCKDCGRLDHSDNIRSENIEEDDLGRDIITFTCPKCKSMQKSFVFMRK